MTQVRVTFPHPQPGEKTRRRLRQLALRLIACVRVTRPLEIIFAPARSLTVEDDYGFGVFITDRNGSRVGIARYAERLMGRRQFTETLAHELVHYEDWRDGKALTHRNHARRSWALAKRAQPAAKP